MKVADDCVTGLGDHVGLVVGVDSQDVLRGLCTNPVLNRTRDATGDIQLWGDACAGFVAEQPVNQWFSDYLKQPVRLVKYNHGKARPSDPIFSKDGDIVSYADGFPLLVISEASLNDLNSKLEQQNVSHVSMTNFRPNLVVAGTTAFEEDQWKKIKIGEVEFDCVKLCSRCVLTTVNPNSGIKSENREPLKTLASYRKMSGGVMFGMNMIPRNSGVIRLGDTLEVLD